jgi:hypothetical protein
VSTVAKGLALPHAQWLQNSLSDRHARSPWLVESLPGHLPAQAAFLAALTTHSILETTGLALLYGTALVIALMVSGMRMRAAR